MRNVTVSGRNHSNRYCKGWKATEPLHSRDSTDAPLHTVMDSWGSSLPFLMLPVVERARPISFLDHFLSDVVTTYCFFSLIH